MSDQGQDTAAILGDGSSCVRCGDPVASGQTVCAVCARLVPSGRTPLPPPRMESRPSPPPRTNAERGAVLTATPNGFFHAVPIVTWLMVGVTALYSAAEFLLASPESAPQQGALGALSSARVVIAYVFARAYDEIAYHPWRRRESK